MTLATGQVLQLQTELVQLKQELLDARERARKVAEGLKPDHWGARAACRRLVGRRVPDAPQHHERALHPDHRRGDARAPVARSERRAARCDAIWWAGC